MWSMSFRNVFCTQWKNERKKQMSWMRRRNKKTVSFYYTHEKRKKNTNWITSWRITWLATSNRSRFFVLATEELMWMKNQNDNRFVQDIQRVSNCVRNNITPCAFYSIYKYLPSEYITHIRFFYKNKTIQKNEEKNLNIY